jgi:dihydrofolate reductase
MGKVILGVTISLDGFAEDINGSVNSLYQDLDSLAETEVFKESIIMTGSVVMSKKEFEMADDSDLYAYNYEYQVPIFVFTDKKPERHPKETDKLSFTFITDGIAETIRQAKIAAGDKDVNIIGSAITTQLCLNEDLIDELQVDIIPILLHNGFRPFDSIDDLSIKLERIEVVELPVGRIHIRYKVIKQVDTI